VRGNDIVVSGRVYPRGKDDSLELIFSAGGTAYAPINISAWSHKDKKTDENVYISYKAIVFGDMAEHLVESCLPGDTVIAAGRLQADNWEDDEGNKRYGQSLLIDEIGVSVRWGTISVNRTESSGGGRSNIGKAQARDSYGANEAPF